MPIRVTCPWCGKKLKASDSLAGKGAKCPACGSRVAVPGDAKPEPQGRDAEPELFVDEDAESKSAQTWFACHSCKERFETDLSMVGRRMPCPGCGALLIVPEPGQVSQPAAPPEPTPTPKAVSTFRPKTAAYYQFKARQRRQRQQWMVMAGIVGSAVLFLLIAVAIKTASNSAGRTVQDPGVRRPADIRQVGGHGAQGRDEDSSALALTLFVLGMLFLVAISLGIFFIPTMIAFSRGHHYRWVIFALNVAGGPTGIGYVVALCWALWPRATALTDPFYGDPVSRNVDAGRTIYERRGEYQSREKVGEHWYYAVDTEVRGPIPRTELVAMLARGQVRRSDRVWKEGMDDWKRAGDVLQIPPPISNGNRESPRR